MSLEKILNAILKKSSDSTTPEKEVSLLRKLAVLALCQIILAPLEKLTETNFPETLNHELTFFREQIDNDNPFGGQI